MTLRFWLWVITVGATLIVSHFQERLFSPYLLLFILLFGLISLVHDLIIRRINIELIPRDEMVQRGESAAWQLKLMNQDTNRTQFLRFTRVLKADSSDTTQDLYLDPRSSQTIQLEVDTRHCGIADPPPFQLSFLSLFGLFRLPIGKRLHQQLSSVYVLPAVRSSLEESSQFGDLIKLGQLQATGREANHDEVDYLREMAQGDPLRLIHWKLSARMQEWMVRQFAKAQEKSVYILIELPDLKHLSDEDSLYYRDQMLERVASEIRSFLFHDFQVTLVTHEPEIFIQTVRGLDRFDTLRKQLAASAPKPTVPLVVQLGGDLGERASLVFYIVSTTLTRETAEELSELHRLSGGVLFEILRDDLTQSEKDLIRELQNDGVDVVITPRGGAQ